MKIKLNREHRALLWAILPVSHPMLNWLNNASDNLNEVYAYDYHDAQKHLRYTSVPVVDLTKKGNLKGCRSDLEALQQIINGVSTDDGVARDLQQVFEAVLGICARYVL